MDCKSTTGTSSFDLGADVGESIVFFSVVTDIDFFFVTNYFNKNLERIVMSSENKLACEKAKRVFDSCKITEVETCKKTMAMSETWPEPELVKATKTKTYTQAHKGSLAVHSNRTPRMLWTACLVHLCRAVSGPTGHRGGVRHVLLGPVQPHGSSAVRWISPDRSSGTRTLFGRGYPPTRGPRAPWTGSIRLRSSTSSKKHSTDKDWRGHLSHLPEDYRDHPYFKHDEFCKGTPCPSALQGHVRVRVRGRVQNPGGRLLHGRDARRAGGRGGAGEGRPGPAQLPDQLVRLLFRRMLHRPQAAYPPLATHPAEERDRQPRFRPLFNTLLVFPDADQLYAQSPDQMLRFLELVRREPTCQVHFGMSEFRLEQLPLSTAALECMCLPQPSKYPMVEHAFSLQSDSWVKSTVVRSPAVLSSETIGVEMSHPGVIGTTPANVSGRLVIRVPPPFGALTSPSDLFRQSCDRKILISVAFPLPCFPTKRSQK